MIASFVTYNIQYGVGQDGRYALGRIVEAVRCCDVICLQEVTTNWKVCDGEDQPRSLAAQLNMFMAYAPGYEVDVGRREADGRVVNARQGFGNMVLSRWPIVYSRAHALPRPVTEVPKDFHPRVDFPRTALETVIDIDGRATRVFSIHLSHLPGGQRSAQIAALHGLVSALPGEPLLWEIDPKIEAWTGGRSAPAVPESSLLFGDFNVHPGDPDYALIGKTGALFDAWEESARRESDDRTSVEADGGLSRLDYLFATADYRERIHSARVDQATKASDHFPVHFEIEV